MVKKVRANILKEAGFDDVVVEPRTNVRRDQLEWILRTMTALASSMYITTQMIALLILSPRRTSGVLDTASTPPISMVRLKIRRQLLASWRRRS